MSFHSPFPAPNAMRYTYCMHDSHIVIFGTLWVLQQPLFANFACIFNKYTHGTLQLSKSLPMLKRYE